MGLDSFIYSIPASMLPELEYFDGDDVKVSAYYYEYTVEDLYQRGNWDFHKFMRELCNQKGGNYSSEDFNGICVRLHPKDIALIEENFKCNDEIIKELKKVKIRLKDPKLAVYYDSSW